MSAEGPRAPGTPLGPAPGAFFQGPGLPPVPHIAFTARSVAYCSSCHERPPEDRCETCHLGRPPRLVRAFRHLRRQRERRRAPFAL